MRAKHVLRTIVLVSAALAAACFAGGVARAVPPAHCQLFGAGGFPFPRLVANEVDRFHYDVPIGVDSVAGQAALVGHPGWAVFLDNDTGSTVTNPRVTMASGLDPSVFDGQLMTPTFPSSCGLPSLDPGQEMQIFPGLEAPGLPTSFDEGYDSSVSVSPSEIPLGGADATATFTVKLTDPRFAGAGNFVHLFVDQGGPVQILSLSGPTNLDQGESLSTGGNGFHLGNAQLGKAYVFTVHVHVANPPFGGPVGPWTWRPGAQIYVSPNGTGCPCDAPGSSVTVADPSLDGSTPGAGAFTFAVDQGDRLWNVIRQVQYVTRYQGGLFPDLNATVDSDNHTSVSASTDSVAAGSTFVGGNPNGPYVFHDWGVNVQNFQQGNVVTGPTISVASGYDPSLLFPDFGGPASSLPIVASQPSLPAGSNLHLGLGSQIPATVVEGCDSSRSVTPLTVPPGGGQQTIVYSVRCTDPGVTEVNQGFESDLPGATVTSYQPPSNLGPNEQLFTPGPAPLPLNQFGFDIHNIVTGKQYTMTLVVQDPNPFGVSFASKPLIKTIETSLEPTGCFGCGGPRTSVTVAVPSLDGPTAGAGSVTVSAGEPHIWTVAVQNDETVQYDGTALRTLDYQGPGSAVDGQPVLLSAFWEGAQGQAGTPVTFTLGSQSCSAVTGIEDSDQTAQCTVVLAQPIGSSTLQVSSPGDVSVYPATTSAPFAITGPTSADQCKNGGWQVFGIFKNQGDCVSYVATHGKNPPG